MNRLVETLLAVLIVLVAGHGFLVWKADDHAQDAAKKAEDEAVVQTCLQRAQTTATIALIARALVAPTAEEGQEAQLQAVSALGTQADAC